MKRPDLALFYSVLFPGLGQLYLGERAKGWTLVCMGAGVMISLIASHSPIACILLGGIYLAVMIPSARDAFQTASGQPRTFSADTIPYVILMLVVIGPFAIPLLWQSAKFSKKAKVLWTLAVILIALFAIFLTMLSASFIEKALGTGAG